MDNARIVDRAAGNDQQAWTELVHRYAGMLRAIAAGFRLDRGDAEDAAQATWLDLVRTIGDLRSHDRIAGWLNTTMRRNCMRVLQRQRWEVLTDVIGETVPDTAGSVEDVVVAADQADRLWNVIGFLPDRQARLLHLLFADGALSYRDVSDAMSMPVGAIGPVRQRALRTLAKLLAAGADVAPERVRRSA